MREPISAVFYDASGKRRARFILAVKIFTAAVLLTVLVFLICLKSDPHFPPLLLSQSDLIADPLAAPEITINHASVENRPYHVENDTDYPDAIDSLSEPIKQVQPNLAPLVFGYYVNWDRSSLASLKMNLGQLTHLVPEWLHLQDGSGAISDETDEDVVQLAEEAHVPVLILISNYRNGWQTEALHAVLRNRRSRRQLENNIRDRVVQHEFAGVNIDFEGLRRTDRDLLTQFVSELRGVMKPSGLLVTEDVPIDDDVYDLKRLGKLNDYVVTLGYDQHYQSGSPGPVAAQWWFENQLREAVVDLPPDKTVVGIGTYGYDWTLGSQGGVQVGFDDVMAAAGLSADSAIAWDSVAGNPVLRYERAGKQHEVWYLDSVTALNEMQAISHNGFRGAAVWRLGTEDASLWKVVHQGAWPGQGFATDTISQLESKQSVVLHGQGEIIRLASTPRTGHRAVRKEKAAYSEHYEVSSSSYIVDGYGHQDDKRIALTFDDGPDPTYTPEVLDILKAKNVPATFFLIGSRVETSVDLVKRIYAEGHTIGNHTYSHPNIETVLGARAHLELSLTQRLIEHSLSRSTTLFRPPYQADSEPATPDDLKPLERAQHDGYTVVGEKIDPRDWETRSAAQIEKVVLQDKNLGNVVLLHDGGGDRSATVAALPRIIDGLRSQGYRFVSVGELLGKTRDQLMPVPQADELRWANVEGRLLVAKGKLGRFIGILFDVVICLTLLRTLVYGTLSILQKRRAGRREFDSQFVPPVSVVIAAYNEEKVILQTVRSILNNGYESEFEVIVIDDGSQDRTLEILNVSFGDDKRIRILTQTNGGKSAALNRGISEAQYEILIGLDADTIFAPGTIAKLVRHFGNPKVASVSGNAKVGNRGKWITRLQALEYIYGFNFDRRALAAVNAMSVIPGAVGAWRKSVVLQCGGLSNDTVAEDTDLTLAIRRRGFEFRYDDEAIASTEAPETIRDLARQRVRWAFGTLQAAWKHRDATFDPQYGTMAFITLPVIWLYQVILAAVSPVAELAILLALFEGDGKIVLPYYLLFLLLEFLTGILAYTLENEYPSDLWILPFQRLFYPHLMLYVVGKSVLYAITGGLMGWTRASRRATVQVVPEPTGALGLVLTETHEPSALDT